MLTSKEKTVLCTFIKASRVTQDAMLKSAEDDASVSGPLLVALRWARKYT